MRAMAGTSSLLVHRVADANRPAFSETFRNSVTELRARATDAMVDHAIDNWGAHGELMLMLDVMDIAKAVDPVGAAAEVYARIVSGVATRVAPEGLLSSLQITSPTVIRRARTLAANLVTKVNQQSRLAIRSAIHQSVMGKIDRQETRNIIRSAIGLNGRQGTALANYATSLYQQGHPKADAMVQKYSERLLRQRAETIARTETMTAANYGQLDAWKSMQAAGYLPADFRMVWMTTGDDRTCEDCAPMDGQTVSLGEQFEQTEQGVLPSERVPYAGDTVDAPPLHAACRCTVGAG